LPATGTTTATVLAQAIYREGSKLVAAGHNPMELKRGIERGVEVVAKSSRSSPSHQGAEGNLQVGTISANNDAAIGNIIAEAMAKVGKEGVITVEESQVHGDYPGHPSRACSSIAGISHPIFVTNRRRWKCPRGCAHPHQREKD